MLDGNKVLRFSFVCLHMSFYCEKAFGFFIAHASAILASNHDLLNGKDT